MHNTFLVGIGFALGLGISSIIYMAMYTRAIKVLHVDNLRAAMLLQTHQTTGIQKVEEQNMDHLTKRLDAIEKRLLREYEEKLEEESK